MSRLSKMISARELSTYNPEELMGWRMERLADLLLKGFMTDAADFSSRYSQKSQNEEMLTGKSLVLGILLKNLEVAAGEPDKNQFAYNKEI